MHILVVVHCFCTDRGGEIPKEGQSLGSVALNFAKTVEKCSPVFPELKPVKKLPMGRKFIEQ